MTDMLVCGAPVRLAKHLMDARAGACVGRPGARVSSEQHVHGSLLDHLHARKRPGASLVSWELITSQEQPHSFSVLQNSAQVIG